ncbi:hypothetical protein BH10ACT9_BH10ACT9_28330 [soil metagenome]
MNSDLLIRAALGGAASAAALLPLAACSSADSTQPTLSSAESSPSQATGSDGTEYEDGTYTARGVYGGAPSYITVTVTVSGDTIADVTVEPMPENNDTSRDYQERFAAAIPDEVLGKSLDEVEVGKLAGSSGTPNGFNAAIDSIREQASANN